MTLNILNVRENIPVDFKALLDTLSDKDIIYIGEFHQVPEVLAFQCDVISDLTERGLKPSIGLEMFNVLQQEILDCYITGIIPFEQLLSLYEMGPEGFDLNYYRVLIDNAAKNRLKVICLNIPRSTASSVARYGLDKNELKSFYLDEDNIKNCNEEYRKTLSSIYRKHPHDDITEENFILAQSIKDEMMSETIVHYLTAEIIGMPLVVITGRGHVEYRHGIPERVKRKIGKKGKTISDVLIITAYEEEIFNGNIADYIVSI
jgi:uncharacterized iron-regulated protein